MINRIPLLILAVSVSCSAIACDKGTTSNKSPANVPAASPEPIPPRKVATTTTAIPDDQIQPKIIELIAGQTGVAAASIKPTTNLRNDLKMDDLDGIRLVMELEDTFGFAIPDEDAKRLSTVAAIGDYVRFRRSSK